MSYENELHTQNSKSYGLTKRLVGVEIDPGRSVWAVGGDERTNTHLFQNH